MAVSCLNCGGQLTPADRYCPACGTAQDIADSSEAEHVTGWDRVLQRLKAATEGEYIIVRQVGRGGMAAVFLAVDTALNRNVAIKVLSPALLMAEGMAERFRDEAITIARLDHPNIIAIHGVRRLDELHFFIMKYVEGRSLDYIIRNTGPLSVPIVRGIVSQIAPALNHAHRHGVVHRDVKPANLLVESTGRVIVSDFGIAKVAESPGLTQTGSMIGTAAYMSPEQCRGGVASRLSDQYSLGVVIYELLTGRPPYTGTPLEIIQAHVYGEFEPLRSKRPDCTPDFESALHRMLSKQSEDRWPSLEEAQFALGAGPRADNDDFRDKLAGLAAPDPEVTSVLSAARPSGSGSSGDRAARTTGPVRIVIQNVPEELETGERARPAGLVVDEAGTTLEREIDWSSTDPDIISVAGDPPTLTGIGPGSARIRAAVRGAPVTADIGVTVIEAKPCTLELSPTSLRLEVGERLAIEATPHDRRGAALDDQVEWTAAGSDLVDVTVDGIVTGRSEGRAELTARVGDVHRIVQVTVVPARVASVLLNPAQAALTIGDSVQIDAMPCDGRGAGLTGRSVTWVSKTPHVASVAADGTVTAWAEGRAEVAASCEGATGVAAIRVTAPALSRIELEGRPDSIRPGEQFRLTAHAVNVRGEKAPVTAEWLSSKRRVASITSEGVVETHRPGKATITARSGSLEARIDLHVASPVEPAAPPVKRPVSGRRILIGLGSAGLIVAAVIFGNAILAGQRGTPAVGLDDGPGSGNSVDPIQPSDSTTTVVADEGPSESDVTTTGGTDGNQVPTDPLVLVLAAQDSILVDQTIEVSHRLVGGDGTTQPGLSWASSDNGIATVSNVGLVRGVAPGDVRITASAGTARESVTIRVKPRPVTVRTVEITSSETGVTVGETVMLAARTLDANNRALPDRTINWTSSDPQLARVDPRTGEVTGVSPGEVTITAESGSARATLAFTVAPRPAQPALENTSPAVAPEAVRFTSLSAGVDGTCGTTSLNQLMCWGFGGDAPAAGGGRFDAIAVGQLHRCALRNGAALCWGDNRQGQLGDGTNTSRSDPTAVGDNLRFVEIVTGEAHSCGLDAQGVVYCWGRNNAGQLGVGNTRSSPTPLRVEGDIRFSDITAGGSHTCGIDRNGRAWCWGDGFSGQIGNNMKQNQSEPYPLNEDYRFSTISGGAEFTCAVTVAGAAMCWGDNRNGQLGDSRNNERLSPVDVARNLQFTKITTGRYHACGLATDNSIHCWGSNEHGQLGTGTTAGRATPSRIASTVRFVDVSAGSLHTCAIADTGAVFCWGDNSGGQVGSGAAATQTTPFAVRANR